MLVQRNPSFVTPPDDPAYAPRVKKHTAEAATVGETPSARAEIWSSDSWEVHGPGFILLKYRPPGEEMHLRLNSIFVTKTGRRRV